MVCTILFEMIGFVSKRGNDTKFKKQAKYSHIILVFWLWASKFKKNKYKIQMGNDKN